MERTIMLRVIGICTTIGMLLAIGFARHNYNTIAALANDVEQAQQEAPLQTLLFGVDLSTEQRAKYESARQFAYSFTPPLTLTEMATYLLLFAGIASAIWGDAIARQIRRRLLDND